MNCCNDYGDCTGGHNFPARATTLLDASRKALAVLSLTGADSALQDELVGAMEKPDRRVAELTAQRDEMLVTLERIASTKPQYGMNPNAKMSDPADVKVCWNVHLIARTALAKHQPTAAPAANTP